MENRNPLISVVIPIYKVEQYLVKCLESVINQTYTNLEIILVEDGSPDQCGKICDEYQNKDSRIRVIHKKNGGLSDARNHGLDIMTGQFVTFIDSDDYIRLDYIENLYAPIAAGKASISMCDIQPINEQGEYLEKKEDGITEFLSGKEVILQEIRGKWEFVTAWGKLYPAEVFRDLRFPLQRYYEDEFIFPLIYEGQENVAYVQKPSYYYLTRAESIMGEGYSQKKCYDYWEMWHERILMFEGKEIQTCIIQSYIAWNVLYITMNGEKMSKNEKSKFKADILKYFTTIFKKPYLFSIGYSIKLAIKCVITLINSKILGKRYV